MAGQGDTQSPIRAAVVGVGVQGKRHAEKLAALPESALVAVFDTDAARARAVADELGAEPVSDVADLIGRVDAAVIASPTSTHYDVGRTLLDGGIHLLVEKPITRTRDEAEQLVRLADDKGLVLQVGHLERYNPVVVALADNIRNPQFIESNRIAPFRPRALDVSVVLDLMIHDIDLIHAFVQSPMAHVDAVGRSVFSNEIDVANARIRFENGCVANVTSSRISTKTERTMRIFEDDAYVSADMQDKTLSVYRRRGDGPVTGPDDVTVERESFGESDAMLDQMAAFLKTIGDGDAPLVSGRTGMEALMTAIAISDMVKAAS